MKTITERFWAKVNKNGPIHPILRTRCWLWVGGTQVHGRYGAFSFMGGSKRAHRVAWFLTHGEFPKKNNLHRCDNSLCVRESHLEDDSQRKNVRDAYDRGLSRRGSKHPLARLNTLKVKRIRERIAAGDAKKVLAREYGVDPKTIRSAVNGTSWRHV